MEQIQTFVAAVFGDQATNVLIGLLIALPIIDWATGSLRALAGGTFQLDAFDVFVRTQIAGRTVPLTIVLITGRTIAVAVPGTLQIPGLDLSLLTAGGAVAAVPFLATCLASIVGNVNPGTVDRVPTVTETKTKAT